MDPFLQKVHARPIIKKYRLGKKLGQGGYGGVYIGTRPLVSIKHSALTLWSDSKRYRDWQRGGAET